MFDYIELKLPQEKSHINNFSRNPSNLPQSASSSNRLAIQLCLVQYALVANTFLSCLRACVHAVSRILNNSSQFRLALYGCLVNRVQASKQIANESGIIFIYLLNRNYKEFESNARDTTTVFPASDCMRYA